MKSTKKSLLTSALSLAVSAALLVGTTFAWFTDSVTNKGNTIQAGKLDIGFQYRDLTSESGFQDVPDSATDAGKLFTDSQKWEPGYTYGYDFRVSNDGTLAAKWQLAFQNITCVGGNQDSAAKLADVIDVYVIGINDDETALVPKNCKGTLSELDGAVLRDGSFGTQSGPYQFSVVLKMKEDAGNNYQGASISFDMVLKATQHSSETDGFGNKDYDKNAEFPSVGTTTKVDSVDGLKAALASAKDGDVIYLDDGHYALTGDNESPLIIDKSVTLIGASEEEAVYNNDTVSATGNVGLTSGTLFTRTPGGDNGITNLIEITADNVTLKNITFDNSICNDDGNKKVYNMVMVRNPGFVGENLYFNNVSSGANGLQLNHGHNASLKNIQGNTYLSNGVDGQIILGLVASENVTVDGFTVNNLKNGSAVWTFQQTVSATIKNLSVGGTGRAIYMDLENAPTWWDPSWGEFKGNHTITLLGNVNLRDVALKYVQDADPNDAYTGMVIEP